jgi:hypothetical protein
MANETALLEEPTETVAPEPTMREAIEAAIDEQETASSTSDQSKPASVSEPTDPVVVPKEGEAATPAVAKPAAPATTEPQTPTPGVSELKAPAQWKPAVREKWNALPREVQEEVLRREGDSMRLIGSVGPKIRLADEVSAHIAPFTEQLKANGATPSALLEDVFSTMKFLTSGSPQEKTEVIANIIESYGIDLRALDAVLSQRMHAGPEVLEARRVTAQAQAVIAQHKGSLEHQSALEAEKTLAAFGADPKHEFLADVKDLMADLIEAGRATTLDDAYSAAVWAHPDTRKILLQREAQTRAAAKGGRAAAARRASSAVHGAPSGAASPIKPNASLRETLEAAFDEHSSL